jgi:nucleoside-diphosphate-sugar epimerase
MSEPEVRFTRGSLIRLAADALLINAALFVASAVRFVSVFSSEVTSASLGSILQEIARAYWMTSPFLTPIALVVFSASGFYTYGRAYRGRYKAIVILQAVTLAYLILGSLSYFQLVPPIPRGMWLGGWVVTLVAVGSARLFSAAWVGVTRWEEKSLRHTADAPIRRVLVIGGAGYVGSALLRRLLGRGYVVRVLDLLLYGENAMAELRSHPHFEFVQGDFRNIETVVRCMQEVDAVIHLGAIVGDPASDIKPEVTYEINVAATRLIAEVARGFGVRRLVFTSTCSVYGASDQLLDERSAFNAVSLYAKSKLAAESILLRMADRQFSPIVLRLGTLYGLSYRPRFDLVVNLLAAKAVREGEIAIIDGEQWRPFVHVEDAARAIVHCLGAPAGLVAGQIFNVGDTRENYRLRDIGRVVCEVVPGTRVRYVTSDGPHHSYRVSCEKIKQWLGFQHTRTVRDGILEIKDAIDRGEIQDYSASEYSNFKFLSEPGVMLDKMIEPMYSKLIPGDSKAG